MGTLSRFHGRRPRDWTIEVRRGYTSALWTVPVRDTYLLSMTMTPAEARQLMNTLTHDRRDGTYVYRGSPTVSVSYQAAVELVRVSDIEVTEAEALRVIRNQGDDPLDVVLGPSFPACGYRLHVVIDQLGRA
jgi:hypothetical protein